MNTNAQEQPAWEIEKFDERQRKEIELCRIYARDFHHGTDGHNAKMIIARMAELLDNFETMMLEEKKL